MSKFFDGTSKTVVDAVQGAKYIIAERISDDAKYRKAIRDYVYHNGVLISKKKKNAEDEKGVYEMYYDYSEKVSRMKPHRVLAVNRGEKEGVLSVSLDVNQEDITSYLERKIIKNPKIVCCR